MSLPETMTTPCAALGCAECGAPLGDSPSSDFCSPGHQDAWNARRAGPPPGGPALYVAERHTVTSDHCVTITDNTGRLIDE